MSKFTPGPWTVIEKTFDNDGYPETPIAAMNERAFVAVALDFKNMPGMREANARLIENAPLMYELIEWYAHGECDTKARVLIDRINNVSPKAPTK